MFHPAIKLTVVTEHFLSDQVCDLIERGGGRGYTLVPVGGKGLHHEHAMSDHATVIEGFDQVKIEAIIGDRDKAEAIARQILDDYFQSNPGIMFLDTVEVCRSHRF
jgi:nitrogen regulatory protein PII